jgi:hypothetical protein
LFDQDLGQVGVAAVLGDPGHVVEELVGCIRTEIGALEFLLRKLDELREVLGAVVDDAQEPRSEARIASRCKATDEVRAAGPGGTKRAVPGKTAR